MKKVLYPILCVIGLALVSCDKEPENEDNPLVVKSVSLNEATHTMEVGEQFTLEATVLPETATNKNVIWRSDNKEIATVSDGTVTAHKAGQAAIIVVTEDGEKSDTCRFTIDSAVKGITLNKTSLGMYVGETFTLEPIFDPASVINQNVIWSNSDDDVVSVVKGLVTALKEGVSAITVTAVDGGMTATCHVSVGNDNLARSNIVWVVDSSKPDGGYLTFATTEADNEQIPANAQGVFFKWGSLVALSPVGDYTPANILFSANGNKNYDWYNSGGNPAIPYTAISANPFQDFDNTADDFDTFNGNTGFDANGNIGDICRYISSKGWVEGKWRMPISRDFAVQAGFILGSNPAEYSPDNREVLAAGTTFSPITVPAEGKNAYGFYEVYSGYFVGPGANADDSRTNPKKGVIFFPAGGGHHISFGAVHHAGVRGYLWTTSSAYEQQAFVTMIYDGRGLWYPEHYRAYANPVRCIRDK